MIASSRLQTLLNAGQFVVSAELTPPRHYKMSSVIAKAEKIAPYVDVVQVNDNVSQARLSNVVAAHFIGQAGVEPVVQLNLRNKNRIASAFEKLRVFVVCICARFAPETAYLRLLSQQE